MPLKKRQAVFGKTTRQWPSKEKEEEPMDDSNEEQEDDDEQEVDLREEFDELKRLLKQNTTILQSLKESQPQATLSSSTIPLVVRSKPPELVKR